MRDKVSMPVSKAPRMISTLPAKPLSGGIPTRARVRMKNIQPMSGYFLIMPPMLFNRSVPAADIIIPPRINISPFASISCSR
ncbi:hypothetical protein D3C80_1696790 [compost metagenome]